MSAILSEDEIPKLPDPDLHDGVTLTKSGKYAGTTDGYSAEAMRAYADAREAAVLEKLAAHPPLGYVHPHAVERLKTGETVPFRKQPYKGEHQIPVYAAPRPALVPVPTLGQIMAVAKAIHPISPYAVFPEWDELRQHEIDALRTRAEKVISAMLAAGSVVAPQGEKA